MKIRNTFIIFLVSGFWHGANWTFIIWGALNALYFMPLLLTNNNRNNIESVASGKILPSLTEFLAIIVTFFLTVIAWIFFRSDTISNAFKYLKKMFSFNFDGGIKYLPIDRYSVEMVLLIFYFLYFEWNAREKEHPFVGKNGFLKVIIIIISIIVFGVYSQANDFIYFQF